MSYTSSYASSCMPGPVQMRPREGPDPVLLRPGSNQMRPLLVPYVCLSSLASESGCSGLLIHTGPRGCSPVPHPPLLPLPPVGLVSGRRTIVVLRRGGIPLHKLTLEVNSASDARFRYLRTASAFALACCAGISVSNAVLGSHEQACHVGNQVLGNLWHRWECRTNRSQRRRTRVVRRIGQVRHVGSAAVELRHTPPRTKPVKHKPQYRVEKSRVTFGALQFVQGKIWRVCFIDAVDTIRACIPLPLEKTTQAADMP